jgi:hypothetical protein
MLARFDRQLWFRMARAVALAATPVVFAASCGNVLLNVTAGSPGSIKGASALTDGTSFANRCGFRASQLSQPGFVLLDTKFKSLPIIASGESQGVKYSITINADVSIYAPASGESTTTTILKVAKIDADDNGRFTKGIADDQVRRNSNRMKGRGMGTGELLALQETPEFKGILCSVGFSASTRTETVDGVSIVDYSPGLPGAVNPFSSLQNFASELGDSRTFTTKVKIVKAGKGMAPDGSTIEVKTTFKKVSPILAQTPGAPAGAPDLKANLAYEITTVGTKGEDVSLYKLDKRRVMFLRAVDRSQADSDEKGEIVAVLSDSGAVDKETNFKQPVVVIVKAQ